MQRRLPKHGCVHSAILAATLYRDGKVASQNKDKGELYAVLALTFGDDSLQQMGEDLMEELVGEGSGYWETPDALSLWLFRKAIKTQSPEMLRQAAEIWLLIGMTSPRP